MCNCHGFACFHNFTELSSRSRNNKGCLGANIQTRITLRRKEKYFWNCFVEFLLLRAPLQVVGQAGIQVSIWHDFQWVTKGRQKLKKQASK